MNENIYTSLGIDEVYLHEALDLHLLKKLQQRAEITLDSTDNIVLKYVTHDIILICHHHTPNQTLIYRFLKLLHQNPKKEEFLKSHTLLNEDEVFEAIKSKTFVLVTPRDISTK